MNVFPIMNVATTQRRGIYVNIPMDVFCNKNALMMQRRGFYANIPHECICHYECCNNATPWELC